MKIWLNPPLPVEIRMKHYQIMLRIYSEPGFYTTKFQRHITSSHYLCSSLSNLYLEDSYNTWDEAKYEWDNVYAHIYELYPELYSKRTKWDSPLWFHSFNERIEILKQILEEYGKERDLSQ